MWREHGSERELHQWIRQRADPQLSQLLDAALAYEHWSRLLQDAFDDCLYCMSKERARLARSELAAMPNVKRASDAAPQTFEQTKAALEPFDKEARHFFQAFASLGEPLQPTGWVSALLEHHRRVQHQKPPHGKNPWFEQFGDGSVAVRPQYLREEGGGGDSSYVHGYRTASLWSFAGDLGMLD